MNYSYRKATTGSSFEAFHAGYNVAKKLTNSVVKMINQMSSALICAGSSSIKYTSGGKNWMPRSRSIKAEIDCKFQVKIRPDMLRANAFGIMPFFPDASVILNDLNGANKAHIPP